MTVRGLLYRCHLFSFAGPQTQGVTSRWTKFLQPVGEREVLSGEVVEMLAEIDAVEHPIVDDVRLRLDIFEQDYLLTGGLDDAIVSYLGPNAKPLELSIENRNKLLRAIEIGPDLTLEAAVRNFRRTHPSDFMDYILVLQNFETGPVTYLVAWWTAERKEDYANAEFYFIVNINEELDDQSEAILDVTEKRVAFPETGLTVQILPDDDPDEASPANQPGLDDNQAPAARNQSLTTSIATVETLPGGQRGVISGFVRLRQQANPPPQFVDQPGAAAEASENEPPKDPYPRWPHPQGAANLDSVVEDPSDLNGRLVFISHRWDAVIINAQRYVVAYDLRRAMAWGQILFGTRAFAILEGPLFNKQIPSAYLVLPTNAEWQIHESGEIAGRLVRMRSIFGVSTRYFQVDINRSPLELYLVRAVISANDYATFPNTLKDTLADEFFGEIDHLNTADPAGAYVPAETAQHLVFDAINDRIDGQNKDLQAAADALARLDVHAFSLLAPADRVKYIQALVNAFTLERHQKALIELIKSIADPTEFDNTWNGFQSDFKDKFVNDLDGDMWSMFVVVGERFGGSITLDSDRFRALFDDPDLVYQMNGFSAGGGLLPLNPTINFLPNGQLDIGVQQLKEFFTAAQAFISFVQSTFEGILTLITEPEKIIQGVAQLVEIMIMVELSKPVYNYPKAQTYVRNLWLALAGQAKNALRGILKMNITGTVARRVKWTVVWEALSMVVGVGEIKAAASALGLTERLAVIGKLLSLLSRGEQGLAKVERVAILFGRAGIASEESAFRLLSHLPEGDLKLLESALEGVDIASINELEELARRYPGSKAVEAVEHIRPRLQAVAALEVKAGQQLSEQAVSGFQRLLSREELDGTQLANIVESIPQGGTEDFLRALQRIDPPTVFTQPGSLYTPELLRELAARPVASRFLLEEGHNRFAAIVRISDGNLGLAEQNLKGLEVIRQRLLASGGEAEWSRLLGLLESGDAAALRSLRDARRSYMLGKGFDIELSRRIERALTAQSEAELATALQDVRQRAKVPFGASDETIDLLERRIHAYRFAERLELRTAIQGITPDEARIFEVMPADEWNTLMEYARPRTNKYRTGTPKQRDGSLYSLKGVVAEEAFFQSREFLDLFNRARSRAAQRGIDPNSVRFVRGTRYRNVDAVSELGLAELTDGLLIAEQDGKIHVLSVIESKSPTNVRDLFTGEEYFGQIQHDYERFKELPSRIDNQWYRGQDIVISYRNTEWVAITPNGFQLDQNLVNTFTSGFTFQHYNHPVRNAILNAVSERILQML